MSALPLFQSLRCFLEMHCLLVVGYALFALGWRFARPRHATRWVRVGQVVLLLALLLPPLCVHLPKQILFRPRAQVWMGGTRGPTPYALLTPALPARAASIAVPDRGVPFSSAWLQGAVALLLLAVGASLARTAWRRRTLARYLRAQIPWKRYRRATLLLSPQPIVPFSARWRGRAYVVLPAELVGTAEGRLAFRHEAVHHRRGDTLWVHAMEVVTALFVGNPAVVALSRLLERLQEFAVDETVVAQGISALDYGRGLFAVAQRSIAPPPGGRALAAIATPTFLRQRIERLLHAPPVSRVTPLAFAGLAAGMLSTAFALRSTVQDRWITLAEARRLAAVPSAVPLEANELVLARLNAYIGTPEGRALIQRGLQRMPMYRRMIESHLHANEFPDELIAIPLFESAFDNRALSTGAGAAGIWQFIAATARRYGLVVDGHRRDDRVQPERETIAAMHYLRDLYREFGDWRLAIKAYNEGEEKVRRLIRENGTREAWRLERISSAENYLSGAIATMILLKNPQIIE